MTQDLNIDVQIAAAPIVREADGLAMSSRNRYLQGEDRKAALCLSRGLSRAHRLFAAGERDAAALAAADRAEIEAEPRAKFEYAEARDSETLLPLDGRSDRVTVLVAARVGPARLIDNITLEGGDS